MGYIGSPWAAETTAVVWKHKNVYVDMRAWSPKYSAPEFISFVNTTGRDKVIFRTDFPRLGFKDCVDKVNTYPELAAVFK